MGDDRIVLSRKVLKVLPEDSGPYSTKFLDLVEWRVCNVNGGRQQDFNILGEDLYHNSFHNVFVELLSTEVIITSCEHTCAYYGRLGIVAS